MKRNKITISDGIVTIPSNPQMTDFEIAELFGVFTQKVRANIKTILNTGILSVITRMVELFMWLPFCLTITG